MCKETSNVISLVVEALKGGEGGFAKSDVMSLGKILHDLLTSHRRKLEVRA